MRGGERKEGEGGGGGGDKRRVYLHVPRANLRRGEGIGFKATLSVPFCAITSLGIVFAALLRNASLRSFLFRNMCI